MTQAAIGQLQTQKQDLEKQLKLKNEELEKRNKELEHEIKEKEDFIANFDADESKWKIKYDSDKTITPHDLPLYCTGPQEQPWNGHPRVFLPIESNSEYTCPYCGTVYRLNGEARGHH